MEKFELKPVPKIDSLSQLDIVLTLKSGYAEGSDGERLFNQGAYAGIVAGFKQGFLTARPWYSAQTEQDLERLILDDPQAHAIYQMGVLRGRQKEKRDQQEYRKEPT